MGRARDPKRDEALRRYVASQGTLKPKQIAEGLSLDARKVRKWKSEDKWDALLALPPEKRNLPKKRGAPFGSKNALGKHKKGAHGKIGNRGGPGAPIGSQRALKTGERATITYDTLSDEEKILYHSITEDPMALVDENIRLLKIRERRMMWNLNKVQEDREAIIEEETRVVWEKGDSKDSPAYREVVKRKKLLVDKIIACEDAITRVQDKLLRAIETKQKMMSEQASKEENTHGDIRFFFER